MVLYFQELDTYLGLPREAYTAQSGSQGSALVDILFGEDSQFVDSLFEEGNSGSVVILGNLPEKADCSLVQASVEILDIADLAFDQDTLPENQAAGKVASLGVPLVAFQASFPGILAASRGTSLDTYRASFLASCRGTFPSYFLDP